MVDVRTLVNARPTGQRGQQNVSGTVSLEQAPPASASDPVYIVIPSLSSELSFPLPWPQIHGDAMPLPGAYVLLAYDENNKPVVVSWESS